MGESKISGPVTIVVIILVLIVLVWLGNRYASPPQTLGPAAQQMREGMRRAHPEQFK